MPSRSAGATIDPGWSPNASMSSGVRTIMSTGTMIPNRVRWICWAIRRRWSTLALITRKSKSLSGPDSPRAAEPKRMIRSGCATATMRRMISWSTAASGWPCLPLSVRGCTCLSIVHGHLRGRRGPQSHRTGIFTSGPAIQARVSCTAARPATAPSGTRKSTR